MKQESSCSQELPHIFIVKYYRVELDVNGFCVLEQCWWLYSLCWTLRGVLNLGRVLDALQRVLQLKRVLFEERQLGDLSILLSEKRLSFDESQDFFVTEVLYAAGVDVDEPRVFLDHLARVGAPPALHYAVLGVLLRRELNPEVGIAVGVLVAGVEDVRFAVVSRRAGDLDGLDLDIDDVLVVQSTDGRDMLRLLRLAF